MDNMQYLSSATIQVDPVGSSGEDYHPQSAADHHDNYPDEHEH